MKNIHIPNPCPEKWDDMSPTTNGAFCGKCATEVLDFTNKSPEEIKATLQAAMGKRVCAKMAPPKAPIKIPVSLLKKEGMLGFRSRFAFSLITVFGMALFSCSDGTYEGPVGIITNEHDVGDVEQYHAPDTIEIIDDTVQSKVGMVQQMDDPDVMGEVVVPEGEQL